MSAVDLLEQARAERLAGRFDRAAEHVAAARAAFDAKREYPVVRAAIELEHVELMRARGDDAAVLRTLPETIERLRRGVMTQLPLELIGHHVDLTASVGIDAARVLIETWERRARADFGPGSPSHDAVIVLGVRVLDAHGAKDVADKFIRDTAARLEQRSVPLSSQLRRLLRRR